MVKDTSSAEAASFNDLQWSQIKQKKESNRKWTDQGRWCFSVLNSRLRKRRAVECDCVLCPGLPVLQELIVRRAPLS